jgi:hypothetical protein
LGVARSLPEIINQLFKTALTDKTGEYTKTVLGEISKLVSGVKKVGFIVIYKIIPNPIEYNIWSLLDKAYLEEHKLYQTASCGVNEIGIIRGRTIFSTPIQDASKKDEIIIIDDVFSNNESDNQYVILESLDGKNFRVLTPFPPNFLIPASWINLRSPNSPSKRLQCYNLILNQELVSNLRDPYITLSSLGREDIHKEESYWSITRNKIKNKIMKDFENLFEANFIEKKKNINIENINSTINDLRLYTNLMFYITDHMKEESIVSELANQTDVPRELFERINVEITLAYLPDLDRFQKGFKKDVELIYRDLHQSKALALLTSSNVLNIKNKLTEIYQIIIEEVLVKYINRKSNIYLTIRKKAEILTKTLINNFNLK